MKKKAAILIIAAMCMNLAACGDSKSSSRRKSSKLDVDVSFEGEDDEDDEDEDYGDDEDEDDEDKTDDDEDKDKVEVTTGKKPKPTEESGASSKSVINVCSYTDELQGIVREYCKYNPEFEEKYDIKYTIKATNDGGYTYYLEKALENGGDTAPDIYCAEQAFVYDFTKGDYGKYAASYSDLGINVSSKIKQAEIAQYVVDIGTNTKGEVIGLGYQSAAGAFIYRRSIARQVFGNDDPSYISTLVGDWDKFLSAAEKLKNNGVSIVPSINDLWQCYGYSVSSSWFENGQINIGVEREAFLTLAKIVYDNGYSNDSMTWGDAWFADMRGDGSKPVFGFLGPEWFINYTLSPNSGGNKVGEGTYGDWAVCAPPANFYWGGTWVMANKELSGEKAKDIGKLIEWITLDTTKNGLQYKWANGLVGSSGKKDSVCSGKVMKMVDGSLDFLSGQDPNSLYADLGKATYGGSLGPYDEVMSRLWNNAVREYISDGKSYEEVVSGFMKAAKDNIGY